MSELIYAVDFSNWNGEQVRDIIAEHQPTHVVVRLGTESRRHEQIAMVQLRQAQEMGCTVSAYVWAYWGLDAAAHVKDALKIACYEPLTMVWLDAEDPPIGNVVEWLVQAAAEVAREGFRPGIYTRKSWWVPNTGNSTALSALPLWTANYDGRATLDTWPEERYGGWEHLSGKQWSNKLPDGTGLDRDVFLPDMARRDVPPADPCAELRAERDALKAWLADTNSKLGAVAVDYVRQLRELADELEKLKPPT